MVRRLKNFYGQSPPRLALLFPNDMPGSLYFCLALFWLYDFGVNNFMIQEADLSESPVRTAFVRLLTGGKAQAGRSGVHRQFSFLRYGVSPGWPINAFHGSTPISQLQHGREPVAHSNSGDIPAAKLIHLNWIQSARRQAKWLPIYRQDVISQHAFQLSDVLVRC